MASLFGVFYGSGPTTASAEPAAVANLPVSKKGEHYKMTDDIVLRNLALIYDYQTGQKFITDRETGELTIETRIILAPLRRNIQKAFCTDAVGRTYKRAIEILNTQYHKDLKANFEESLKENGGLDRMIAYYSPTFYGKNKIAEELKEIKGEINSARKLAAVP